MRITRLGKNKDLRGLLIEDMEILEGLPQQHAFTTRSATNLHNDLYSEVF